MTQAPDLLVGQTIQGRYRVLRLIGRGGMGSVYEVEHLAFGGRFALKTLRAELGRDSGSIRRFRLEARAAAATGHKHVVQVTDMGELDDGMPFIVLELLRGRSLAKEIATLGRLSAARSVSIALQCCAALAATHERGIVHRDLKPENIFLLSDHAPADFVKVLDFGVSKFTEAHPDLDISRRTTEGTQIGTPVFMSPEQLAGSTDVGPAADQFSLGVVLYEMLTGRLPFEERSFAALVVAITTAQARPPSEHAPDVPPALDAVVMRTLEKRPENRFASMTELAMALLPLHRPAHADTSGGWTAALGDAVAMVEVSGVEPAPTTEHESGPGGATTLPRRKPPVKEPPGPTDERATNDESPGRSSRDTGPIASRDSVGGAEAIDRSSAETRESASRPSSRPWTTRLVASAAAIALVVTAALLGLRFAGGGGAGSTSSAERAERATSRVPASSDGDASARASAPGVVADPIAVIAPDAGELAARSPLTPTLSPFGEREPGPEFRVSPSPRPAGDGEVATRPSASDGREFRVSPSPRPAGDGEVATRPSASDGREFAPRPIDAAPLSSQRGERQSEGRAERGASPPPASPRTDPRRAGRDAGRPRVGPDRPPSSSGTRSVTIRSEWDASVSLRFACGERTVRATVPPFGSRTVTLPAADCLVHCASAAGLPRCPLRLPATASTVAVRR
ncbi:MAG: protein kinase [Deltaproteobacteria bacterium]|nr:protein kinase [Deltaproteobacteria bacterium]